MDVPILLYIIWELLSNTLFVCIIDYMYLFQFLPLSSSFFFPVSSILPGRKLFLPEVFEPCFLLLANQNRYANEVLNMPIRWRQTTWVVLVPPLLTYQVWWKSVIAFSFEKRGLPFDVDEKPTSVHTSRQRDKWKLSGPSSIAGGPQTNKQKTNERTNKTKQNNNNNNKNIAAEGEKLLTPSQLPAPPVSSGAPLS